MNTVKIDGVSYNVDHAKAIGKEAWTSSMELQHHHQHLPETDRKKALAAVYDQIVAPLPTPSSKAATNN